MVWEKFEDKESSFLKNVEIPIEENIFKPDFPSIIGKIKEENLFLSYLKHEGISSLMIFP